MKYGITITLIIGAMLLWSCGGNGGSESGTPQTAQNSGQGELTAWELENGIGPIKSDVKLGPIDDALVATGDKIFETKCTPCHKLDERYIGPALGDVTKRRTPEFVMNMVLNPDEMVKKHPEGKKMLAEFLAPMTFQNISEEDARALLEYLRANTK